MVHSATELNSWIVERQNECAMYFQVQIVSHDSQLIKLLDVTNASDTHYGDKTVG